MQAAATEWNLLLVTVASSLSQAEVGPLPFAILVRRREAVREVALPHFPASSPDLGDGTILGILWDIAPGICHPQPASVAAQQRGSCVSCPASNLPVLRGHGPVQVPLAVKGMMSGSSWIVLFNDSLLAVQVQGAEGGDHALPARACSPARALGVCDAQVFSSKLFPLSTLWVGGPEAGPNVEAHTLRLLTPEEQLLTVAGRCAPACSSRLCPVRQSFIDGIIFGGGGWHGDLGGHRPPSVRAPRRHGAASWKVLSPRSLALVRPSQHASSSPLAARHLAAWASAQAQSHTAVALSPAGKPPIATGAIPSTSMAMCFLVPRGNQKECALQQVDEITDFR